MKKNSSYMTRALSHRDPRFARILGRLGYEGRAMVAEEPKPDELASLREQYQAVVGKRPFMGWDADTMRQKMAEAQES